MSGNGREDDLAREDEGRRLAAERAMEPLPPPTIADVMLLKHPGSREGVRKAYGLHYPDCPRSTDSAMQCACASIAQQETDTDGQ